ncbi:MAG TPA: molybdate ABC transporter substrate-binding protein [Candidatus Bathyarchaeia archaeon]|nr:molybdate ABC transporter substrate-binding protein [Candidatus Bathyarchaeia archaeon]
MNKKKIIPVLLCALLSVLVVTTCGCTTTSTPSTKLTVFAAASLTGAFNQTAQAFEANNTGVNVTFNYAGSQVLVTQIQQGASADVFASADLTHMNSVKNAGLMNNSSIVVFAYNYLAIIVPTSNPANITSLSDLAKPGVKLDIANSSVPVGNYTLQMLAKASNNSTYGSGFENSVLANRVSEEVNVNDVVTKVALGQADAGIVYKSDVPAAYQSKVTVIQIPHSVNVLATYPIGVVSSSPNAQLAQSFINYVMSPDGQVILQSYGFIPATSMNTTTAATTSAATTSASQSATTAAA